MDESIDELMRKLEEIPNPEHTRRIIGELTDNVLTIKKELLRLQRENRAMQEALGK